MLSYFYVKLLKIKTVMFIYFILIILFLLSIKMFGSNSKKMYIFFVFLLTFIAFFRSKSVGADNFVYFLNFKNSTMNPLTWSAYTEFEPGFAWFTAFFKTYISNNYLSYMGTLFLVYMIGVNNIIKRFESKLLCLFFWVLFLFYTLSFNIMRQSFALGVYFLYFPLLIKMEECERKRNKYFIMYLGLVLLTTFYLHRSIIIMAIIPVFIYLKNSKIFNNKKYLLGILLASYVLVFINSLLYKLIPYIIGYFTFLGDRYVGYIATSSDAEVTISKLSSLMNVIFAMYVVKICPQEKINNYLLQTYILSVVLSNLLGSFSDLFLRIALNLSFFQIFVFSYLWTNIHSFRDRLQFRFFLIIYGMIMYSNAIIKNFGLIVPYSNQFF